jgi:hypothetical protein
LRVLAVGLGNMGMSHAKAYTRIDGFDVAGLCGREQRYLLRAIRENAVRSLRIALAADRSVRTGKTVDLE